MRGPHLLALALLLFPLTACGGDSGPSSPGGTPPGGNPITGNERLGWTQTAGTADELAMYSYALYVDNQRRVIEGETCTRVGTTAECTVRVPALGAGQHTLEIAAFFTSGGEIIEGPRSSALQVNVSGVVAPAGSPVVVGGTFASSDGLPLHADILARDLVNPVDLAVAADGRVFVAERAGRLRIVTAEGVADAHGDNVLSQIGEDPANGAAVRSLALAPDFDSSGLVHVAYVSIEREQPILALARLRELRGTMGQPAIVASYPVSALDISAVLRFGPDAKLHVGIGTGSNPDAAQSASAASGKILRLNEDGTTPEDNPAGSPVLSIGHRDPHGLAWRPQDQSLWEVEQAEPGDEVNRIRIGGNYGAALTGRDVTRPGLTAPAYVLDAIGDVTGLATIASPDSPLFGDLIVSTLEQRDVLRFAVRADGGLRLAGRLLRGRYGRIAQVAAGPDGALYFVTANDAEWGPGADVLVRVRASARVPHRPRS